MNDEGDVQHRLLWGPAVDQALADDLVYENNEFPDETYWHLTDHQGSVRDIVAYDPTSEEVVLASHHKYNAFGVRSGDTMSTFTIGYTGKYFDPDTGLQYHQYAGSRGRWLDPLTGRWRTQDPIGFEADDPNLYRYVGNSAANRTDPDGLREYPIFKPGPGPINPQPAPGPGPAPGPSPGPGPGPAPGPGPSPGPWRPPLPGGGIGLGIAIWCRATDLGYDDELRDDEKPRLPPDLQKCNDNYDRCVEAALDGYDKCREQKRPIAECEAEYHRRTKQCSIARRKCFDSGRYRFLGPVD